MDGSAHGVIGRRNRNFPGGTEENHEETSDPTEVRTRQLPNTSRGFTASAKLSTYKGSLNIRTGNNTDPAVPDVENTVHQTQCSNFVNFQIFNSFHEI
jgi:hypothetical protein